MSHAPDTLAPADTWRTAAACTRIGADPDLWFVDGGARADRERAIAICRDCPVLTQCRDAVAREESGSGKESRYGIRAGLTPKERWEADKTVRSRAMPSGGGRRLAPCGTRGAYERHIRRHEPVDDACREANTAHNQKLAKRRAA
ncbi:WhiB family transcriptional regulator [Streptomyces sp. NPDC059913]|uniref:WhiB family transcriptional regulator n=1 Tax=unclassified Streptomyces TaxID=2593676 RepID=UPI0036491DCB